MTSLQKTIKYLAIAFAIFLTVSIFAGIFGVLGAFSLIDNIFEGDASESGEMIQYDVADEINDLKIEVGAADFSVIVSDRFYVESNIPELSVKEDGACLEIESDDVFKTSIGNITGGTLNIYIPNDYIFDEANIDTGAGNVLINELCVNDLELNLGAGEVNIENLVVYENTEISGGAGAVSVKNCVLNNADISMGIGEFEITGEMKGKNNISLGVGETTISLTGNKDDYELFVTKGLGEAMIDGNRIEDSQTVGNGKNKIEISGGVGEVNVAFVN